MKKLYKSHIFLSVLMLFSARAYAIQDIISTAENGNADLSVTAYNKNIALVRDKRTIKIPEGRNSLMFMDVAQQIKPETVALRSLSNPGSLDILEQNYEYDLISPSKLLDKHVGKELELVNFSKDTGFDRKTVRLISNNQGPVYQDVATGKIYLDHPGSVVVPEIPNNLVDRPSLVWLLNNSAPSPEQVVEVMYITNGIQWNADYVVTLDRADDKLNLQGWVTLTNNSGTGYNNAQLKLIAGDVNIAQEPRNYMMYERAFAKASVASDMQQEAFGDLHLYTLPERTSIRDNQKKQVNLLHASDVKAQKHYEYRGENWYHFQHAPTQKNQKVAVYVLFDNTKANELGVPLPAGVMRVYQEDSSGALQFSGEDRIDHTPENQQVRLKLGNAFDVNVDRVQTAFNAVAQNVYESSYEITIRNQKSTPVVVDVIEPMSGKWNITHKSLNYTKTDSHTARFSVPVPAKGKTTLEYTVRVDNRS